MAENSSSPNKNQILSQVKDLCVKGKFSQSRQLICQAADIKDVDPMGISRSQIRSRTANKQINHMLDIEQAFVSLAQTFRDGEPQSYRAENTIAELKKVLPLLNRTEKAFAFYWISNCLDYTETANPNEQFEALQKTIMLTKSGSNEVILYTCANKISGLDIGSKDKYKTIKSASLKTSKTSPYIPHYQELLDRYARHYFDEVSRRANHPSVSYPDRNAAFETAVELVNDFRMPALQKCAYKIGLLNSLENLQRQHGDTENLNKTSARKQNFIFRSAQLRRKATGYRVYNDNYR